MTHVIVWEFVVKAERRADFERVYGPQGDWAKLFSRGDGFLGTELLRDRDDKTRFVTIDRWQTPEAFSTFHTRYEQEYRDIDAIGEAWTVSEKRIGEFEAG